MGRGVYQLSFILLTSWKSKVSIVTAPSSSPWRYNYQPGTAQKITSRFLDDSGKDIRMLPARFFHHLGPKIRLLKKTAM
jgi:hypothetical protein